MSAPTNPFAKEVLLWMVAFPDGQISSMARCLSPIMPHDASGAHITHVQKGGIGELNGLVKGDKILEVNKKEISAVHKGYYVLDALADLSNKFGKNVSLRILRGNREMVIRCRMYYPQLEEVEEILLEIEKRKKESALTQVVKDVTPPKIRIVEPRQQRGLRVSSRENPGIDFVIIAGDDFGMQKVTINGKMCQVFRPSALEKSYFAGDVQKYTRRFPAKEGENQFKILAVDTSGNETAEQIVISYQPEAEKKPAALYQNSVAVVIGIDKYTRWPGLECAVSDASAIKKKLFDMGFDQVLELHDHQATRLRVMNMIGKELPAMLGKEDRVFVFFAGHGQTETYKDENRQNVKEGYLIPVDGDLGDYRETAISMTSIREVARGYRAKHVLFAFDSCYSGLGLQRGGGAKKTDDYIRKLAGKKCIQILTAGGENEQVSEEGGHGVFTRHLLLALDGEADRDQDGFITAFEIGAYIRPAVSRKTENRQTPKFGWLAGEGDFIFERSETTPR